jgi:hypothetical protein
MNKKNKTTARPPKDGTVSVLPRNEVVAVNIIPANLGTFNGIALTLAPGISLDNWKRLGAGFAQVHAASGWALGDWLNGGAEFEKTEKKAYKEAVAATGIDYGRLRIFASIAKRFPAEQRRPGLSFEHHRILAPMKDDKVIALMDRAENEQLSTAATREIVPKTKPKKPKKETDEQRKVREAKEDEAFRLSAKELITYMREMPDDRLKLWPELLAEMSESLAGLESRIGTYEEPKPEATTEQPV